MKCWLINPRKRVGSLHTQPWVFNNHPCCAPGWTRKMRLALRWLLGWSVLCNAVDLKPTCSPCIPCDDAGITICRVIWINPFFSFFLKLLLLILLSGPWLQSNKEMVLLGLQATETHQGIWCKLKEIRHTRWSRYYLSTHGCLLVRQAPKLPCSQWRSGSRALGSNSHPLKRVLVFAVLSFIPPEQIMCIWDQRYRACLYQHRTSSAYLKKI